MSRAGAVTAEQTGLRVQQVLDQLADSGDPALAAAGEELVRDLLALHREGLSRLVELLPPGSLRGALVDPAAAGLLVLHDLHPEDVSTRIARALESVPAHPVEVVAFEAATGTLRVRREQSGGGCGCGGTEDAARTALEDALGCFAPEVAAVELVAAPAPLLQISTRPPVSAEVR
ncbi:NifU family protein [Kitasatospora nipponensis]|uniref:NifU family protein n=1 Tax=Kitasatospora nipponensis TaxID=258049 RepID=A0ABP4HC60_9ACTN